MFAVETYATVRRPVFTEGKSRREAARFFGLSRDTVSKMCRYSASPGPHEDAGAAEAEAFGSGDRRDPGDGQGGSGEAAASAACR